MNKSYINNNRRGLYANMTVAKPHSQEEKDFIKTFASALNHATAVIAANPSISVIEGSLTHRIQREFSRLPPKRQSEIGTRASALLSKSNEQRLRHFGAYSDLGAQFWSQAKPGLDDKMKQQLRKAVHARLDAQRSEIEEILAIGVPNNLPYPFPPSKTTLEVGFFGDVQAAWTSMTITSPISINLRWETDAQEAERGMWQLYIGGESGPEVQLGSGNAGPAPGGVFKIDLGNYLPPTPPSVPTVYRIRVIPKTKSKRQERRGRDFAIIPGKAVGLASNDVEITYSAVGPPPVKFDYYEYYTAANFVLESIYMVQDSHEMDTEEFHVAGFVQESFPTGSAWPGDQGSFRSYAELDIDGPRRKNLHYSSTFNLGKPTLEDWPRAFSVVISVLEEDDGSAVNDWISGLWAVADDLASGEIEKAVRDYLEDQFKDYIGDNIGNIINMGAQMAQMIAALISGTVNAIVAVIVAAAAFAISAIVASLPDDYYGTEAFVFVLPSNLADYVHSLPGQPFADGFRLESQSLSFRGPAVWPEAGIFDGMVEVSFHFELTGKVGNLQS